MIAFVAVFQAPRFTNAYASAKVAPAGCPARAHHKTEVSAALEISRMDRCRTHPCPARSALRFSWAERDPAGAAS